MKKTIFIVFWIIKINAVAQDSVKIWNHEIGFNTVSLVKQLISNNPSAVLPQLPYDFFYNLYYKNTYGLRLGSGISITRTETEIEGQKVPRVTDARVFNFRAGFSYNFAHYNKVTLNGFADYIGVNNVTETSNTSTVQTFPNPIQKITTTTSETTRGGGTQIGMGVMYNLHKHISIYAEMPVSFMRQKSVSTVTIDDTGTINSASNSSIVSGVKLYVPTTIYLVLRF